LREAFEDHARAIGIVLVVYGHVLRGLLSEGITPVPHWIAESDYAIYTFHMPLFFMLSGLHAERSLLRLGRRGFLATKCRTIVYPYILWSITQGLIQWLAVGYTNHPISLTDLGKIPWHPLGQFWFLYALFLCQIYICLVTTERVKLATVALFSYAAGSVLGIGILTTSFKFFLFFVAGILLASRLRCTVSRIATLPCLAITLAALCGTIHFAREFGDYDSFWALPAATLGILLVFEIAILMTLFGELKAFRLLGMASMPIYLAHIIFESGARIILTYINVDNFYLQLFIGLLCGLGVPLTLYAAVVRMRVEPALGFPRYSGSAGVLN
jgi:fucose 4-O-acetylase-like acetyltransferase